MEMFTFKLSVAGHVQQPNDNVAIIQLTHWDTENKKQRNEETKKPRNEETKKRRNEESKKRRTGEMKKWKKRRN